MFVIGNIKIDETRPERVQYFFATLLSYMPFKEHGVGLTLNESSENLFNKTNRLLKENFEEYSLVKTKKHIDGPTEFSMFTDGKNANPHIGSFNTMEYWDKINIHCPDIKTFYLTFEEDHFCMLQNDEIIPDLIDQFFNHKADIIRASFNRIEQTSAAKIKSVETGLFKTFVMNKENHQLFCEPYGYRYFIGTNNIIRTWFAHKLYCRHGDRPHDFEIGPYNSTFEYTCAIPKIEIMRAIDDDHGEANTCLLKAPTEKFNKCMELAKKYL